MQSDESSPDDDLRTKTGTEIKYSLSLLIEDFGDIPISSINVEKGTQFKSHLKNFPKNRNKLPKFRDKSFHEIMGMKIKDSERISLVTLNKHIGYVFNFISLGSLLSIAMIIFAFIFASKINSNEKN